MKVSTRVECGIIALMDMVIYSKRSEAMTAGGIAARENISVKYLEQIFAVLRQAKIIRGLKGSRGGYVIAKPPDKITVREIIDALDINILSDVFFEDYSGKNAFAEAVNTCVWNKMTEGLQAVASEITLADLAEEYLNISASQQGSYMYFI